MTKKKALVITKPKCHVTGCDQDAAFGFRETIAATHSTSKAREFIMGALPNWCLKHDADMRVKYEGKSGDYVRFQP